mmetsp:Transcript_15260/g.47256  ORF Transcript_15260/g.47256 Transcript_15260/m.47256 type:complete len:203 (+) Transcript_15260:666-1274(+)
MRGRLRTRRQAERRRAVAGARCEADACDQQRLRDDDGAEVEALRCSSGRGHLATEPTLLLLSVRACSGRDVVHRAAVLPSSVALSSRRAAPAAAAAEAPPQRRLSGAKTLPQLPMALLLREACLRNDLDETSEDGATPLLTACEMNRVDARANCDRHAMYRQRSRCRPRGGRRHDAAACRVLRGSRRRDDAPPRPRRIRRSA